MNINNRFLLCSLLLTISITQTAFPHSGRTDKYGGHNDRKTGGYHYHNAGDVKDPNNPYQKHTIRKNEKKDYRYINYKRKHYRGFSYQEVTNIELQEKKQIYFNIVREKDITGDDDFANKVISNRHDIPTKAVESIVAEGALKRWPIPKHSSASNENYREYPRR